jgi:hypothetical protein
VAYLPSPKDFDLARLLGWYRIPLKSAPKMIEVDYFAFYQGNRFGEMHRWRIEFLAKYEGHELTTRGELLRDEANHPRAKEEYYKIQLGSLIPLEQPILAGTWKRITFLYTTGELVNRAITMNDLTVPSEDREVLWQSLRERSKQVTPYDTGRPSRQELDPGLLKLILSLNSDLPQSDLDNY